MFGSRVMPRLFFFLKKTVRVGEGSFGKLIPEIKISFKAEMKMMIDKILKFGE